LIRLLANGIDEPAGRVSDLALMNKLSLGERR
jgi:hypothetical protein